MYEVIFGFVLGVVGYWIGYRRGARARRRKQGEFVHWI